MSAETCDLGAELEAEVRRLAADDPERTAECRYVCDGKPMCIVGHALINLDVLSVDVLGRNNLKSIIALNGLVGGLGIDRDRLHWLEDVQHWQDSGKPWAEAVASADVSVDRFK